jgi:CRP-like cAMP-binding protein
MNNDVVLERRDWRPLGKSEATDALGRIRLFEGLGRRRLRRLARTSQFARFVPGDVVASSGGQAAFFHVVLGGHAEARDTTETRRIGPGDHFGGGALLGRETGTPTVVATDELQLMRLPRPAFLELASHEPQVALAIVRELAERSRRVLPDAA